MTADDKAIALQALKWRDQPNRFMASKARSLQRKFKACKHARAVRHLHATIDVDLCPIPAVRLQKLKDIRKKFTALCLVCGKEYPIPRTCSPACTGVYREWFWKKEKLLQMELEKWFAEVRELQRQCAWRFALSRENV
jgi:hypothetical protein